jgi:hypothetical protein
VGLLRHAAAQAVVHTGVLPGTESRLRAALGEVSPGSKRVHGLRLVGNGHRPDSLRNEQAALGYEAVGIWTERVAGLPAKP